MSYDQWKCTDPRDDREEEEEVSELDLAYDRIKALEGEAKLAGSAIRTMVADLSECLAYLEKHYDVIDGRNGEPALNEAMRLGQMIEITIRVIASRRVE